MYGNGGMMGGFGFFGGGLIWLLALIRLDPEHRRAGEISS